MWVETWDLVQQLTVRAGGSDTTQKTDWDLLCLCFLFYPREEPHCWTFKKTHNKYFSVLGHRWGDNCSLLCHLMASGSAAICPSLPPKCLSKCTSPWDRGLCIPITCSAHPATGGSIDFLSSYKQPCWGKAWHCVCLQIDLKYMLKWINSLIHTAFSTLWALPVPLQPLGESRAWGPIQMLYWIFRIMIKLQCKSLWFCLYWKYNVSLSAGGTTCLLLWVKSLTSLFSCGMGTDGSCIKRWVSKLLNDLERLLWKNFFFMYPRYLSFITSLTVFTGPHLHIKRGNYISITC